MSAKYPPFVNAYGSLTKLLEKIKTASVPTKVTRDYLSMVLGLKSSSYHPMIPFLKRLGFLDQSGVPTQRYKDFRSDSKSGFIMAKAMKEAYSDLYDGNEYAQKLQKQELIDLVATRTGASKNDTSLTAVVGTFIELKKHATFELEDIPEDIGEDKENETEETIPSKKISSGDNVKFGISYTINLNLPATTEIKVFDAIFKSLKKNIIDNE